MNSDFYFSCSELVFRDVFLGNVFSKQLEEESSSGPFVARSCSMTRP